MHSIEPTLTERFPSRSLSWKLRTRTLHFGDLPLVMGIVNVTPDSFSDGGRFDEPQRAVEHALRLAAQGAGILDVGGESTRPYSTPVDEAEELRRVLPVVVALREQTSLPVSIDTSKAAVAREAIAAGAEIINDITGMGADPAMLGVALEHGAGVCVMHMQGTPQTMQDNPAYDDVVEDVLSYLGRPPRGASRRGSGTGTHLSRPRNRLWQDAPAQPDASGPLRPVSRSRPASTGRAFPQRLPRQGAGR
jgi:dihydropteroate synthase